MKYLLFILVSSFLIACNGGEAGKQPKKEAAWELSEDAANLYQIVGEKHDTAMLLMSNIEGTRSKLRIAMNVSEMDSIQKDSILNLLTALKKADEGMMNWMNAFKSTELNEAEYQAMSETEILTYLKEEEKKIEQVHLDMLESIQKGTAFLEQ